MGARAGPAGAGPAPTAQNLRGWLRLAASGYELMQRERFGGGAGVVEDVAGEDAEVERADGGDA